MSSPQRPWQQPTAFYPAEPPKKKPVLKLVLWSVLAAVVFCFGGLATLGAFLGEPDKPAATRPAAGKATAGGAEPGGAADDPRPLLAAPASSSPVPASGESTGTAEPSAPAKPKPAPATTRPKPK